MFRVIKLFRTCCGGNTEEVPERVEMTSNSKQPSGEIIILKSASIGAPSARNSNPPSLPAGNSAVDLLAKSDNKARKKRKKKVKKQPIEVPPKIETKLAQRQDDDSLEAKKEMSFEESKSAVKPLKGILKNRGR